MKKLRDNITERFIDEGSSEILKKGFSFLLFRLGGLLAGYLFTYIIATKYGASVNGLVVLCFSIFVLVSILGKLGVDINLVKFYATDSNLKEDPGIFYRAMGKSVLFSVLLAAVLFAFRDFFVVTLFDKPQLRPFFKWLVLAIPFWVIVGHCGGVLRAIQQNSWYAFLNSSGRFFFSVLILWVLSMLSLNQLDAIKAHFFAVLLLAVIGLVVASIKLKKVSFRSKKNSWVFMREAFPMMLSSTILVLLGWMDTFILGIYETDAAVGVYNVALKIAALTSFSLEAINSILAPKISKYFQLNDKKGYTKLIRFSTGLNFLITVFVVALLLTLNKWVLGIFGEEFKTGSTALIILCLGQLVNSMSGSVGIIMQMTGYQKQYQNIVLLALIINLILNFVLTPLYGITGAAIATVISISFWNITGSLFLKKKEKLITYFNPFRQKQ